MTITLDLSSVQNFFYGVWFWVNVHPYHVVTIWYVAVYLFMACFPIWTQEEYNKNTNSNDMPAEIQSILIWLFSPIVAFFLLLCLFGLAITRTRK